MKKIFLFTIILSLFSSVSVARADGAKNMLFIFDASGSMLESFGNTTKIIAAKSALSDIITSLHGSIITALRPFGNVRKTTQAEACKQTELLMPFGSDRNAIIGKVNAIDAIGTYTPTAYALSQAQNDFIAGNDNSIILLTDGKDTCGGDPVASAKALLASSAKIKTYVIGLGVDDASRTQLSAIATAGGAKYFDATDSASLISGFKAIQDIEKPIDKTNTDKDIAIAIRGGNGYDTAVAIDPASYHLDHNQKNGDYDYFKISVTENVPITLTLITTDKAIGYDSATKSFVPSKQINAGLKIQDKDRVEIGKTYSVQASTKNVVSYTPSYTGFIYLLVGPLPDYYSSAYYSMDKSTTFKIEVAQPSPTVIAVAAGQELAVTPVAESSAVPSPFEGVMMYVVMGIGFFALLIIALRIKIFQRKSYPVIPSPGMMQPVTMKPNYIPPASMPGASPMSSMPTPPKPVSTAPASTASVMPSTIQVMPTSPAQVAKPAFVPPVVIPPTPPAPPASVQPPPPPPPPVQTMPVAPTPPPAPKPVYVTPVASQVAPTVPTMPVTPVAPVIPTPPPPIPMPTPPPPPVPPQIPPDIPKTMPPVGL
ncbi:MAG: VWA domain-containing protein [Candidatus Pacebacteria bacterium]|nr:VWA domain-containing protein [Candidatus Paceibacterota bacterium]